ncbi:hypothetical protein MWN52_09460 [Pseudoxanthomonas winnipegensis]|uniref:hypothetical protein n=1 Tax=Pseudoxanthomonas winnipegensis TaxID=2480810 RepID=UPI002575FE4C|nr:hypothetical protein [Pseudoxanthomonas winnipegensis]WJI17442.1 hypothetical protein MWN52_09460 [Pseudoxanthomonas winnipegensis]
MKEVDTISWIFLAIWFLDKSTVTRLEISHSADAINHAMQLESELDLAIDFLAAHGLIEQNGDRYSLTKPGKQMIAAANQNSGNIFDTWATLKNGIATAGAS